MTIWHASWQKSCQSLPALQFPEFWPGFQTFRTPKGALEAFWGLWSNAKEYFQFSRYSIGPLRPPEQLQRADRGSDMAVMPHYYGTWDLHSPPWYLCRTITVTLRSWECPLGDRPPSDTPSASCHCTFLDLGLTAAGFMLSFPLYVAIKNPFVHPYLLHVVIAWGKDGCIKEKKNGLCTCSLAYCLSAHVTSL